jgi:ubiquitin carboxyl-terminal hydrolase 10
MRLLTSGPSASAAAAAGAAAISYAGSATSTTSTNATTTTNLSKIRPRGLINSGNTCLADSVLQIMVYYSPFHRSFAELGRVLGGSGPSGSSGLGVSSGMNGINRVSGTSGNGTAAEASVYPLVETTVGFLREFVVDDDRSKDLKEKGNANSMEK